MCPLACNALTAGLVVPSGAVTADARSDCLYELPAAAGRQLRLVHFLHNPEWKCSLTQEIGGFTGGRRNRGGEELNVRKYLCRETAEAARLGLMSSFRLWLYSTSAGDGSRRSRSDAEWTETCERDRQSLIPPQIKLNWPQRTAAVAMH